MAAHATPYLPPIELIKKLHQLAAQLDGICSDVQRLHGRVEAALGSTATGVDKDMVSALSTVSKTTRRAQREVSRAATALTAR